MAKEKPKKKLSALIKRSKDNKLKPLTRAKELVKGKDAESGEKSPVRITNDTVAKHREEVLSGARRFIYPLQHSKHRIAITSGIIVTAIFIALLVLSWFMLYRQQSTSDFAYRVSQIMPFPVARVDGNFVRYEEYLFELRQNMHYLTNQENVDFGSEEGQAQLDKLRTEAMERTLDKVVIRKMADDYEVTVSEQEIAEQIDLIRSQSGVGEGTQTLEDTLEDFYGWGLGDLRRVIRDQILAQKLVPLLDTEVREEAEQVLQEVKDGEEFSKAAADHSDDNLTNDKGGVIGYVFRSNTDIPPQLVERAFNLAAGEVSEDLVETLFGLHIVKTVEYRNPDEAQIAHILFRYEDIETFVNERQEQLNSSVYITIEDAQSNENSAPAQEE